MEETDRRSDRADRTNETADPRNDHRGRDPPPQEKTARPRNEGQGERLLRWFTETMLRLAVAGIGVALLLLALGQIVGVDLYSIVLDFLQSSIGQWSVVAIFAVLLILAASKRWNLVGSR